MSWSSILGSIATAIEAATSLTRSKVVFDVDSVGQGAIGKVFCFGIEMGGSPGVPGSGRVVDTHTLDIRMLYRLGDEYLADFGTIQDDSEAIRDALALRPVNGLDIVFGDYSTERVDEASEYVIRTMPVEITHTNSIGS